LETLLTCERKFQLDKLLITDVQREETEHTVFGTAFGAGVATYLATQDPDMALYQAWLSYWPELESEKKSQTRCFAALMSAFLKLDTILMDYEVVSFNDRPAVELSFRLKITERYYFVGHIDTVVKNKYTGLHYVFECKTTGLNLLDLSPLYKNSGQALGYSIALDKITGEEQASYGVIYFVAQLGKEYKANIHVLPYEKTLTDRLNWFITLGLDVKRLEQMEELGVYPKRGKSCLNYMRPCKYFGTCGLHGLDVPRVQTEDEIDYDFSYELEALIQNHLQRMPMITIETLEMREI
jgi:hypothetical protein